MVIHCDIQITNLLKVSNCAAAGTIAQRARPSSFVTAISNDNKNFCLWETNKKHKDC